MLSGNKGMVVAGICLVAMVFAAGCNSEGGTAGGGSDDKALISAGMTVYNNNGCANCHAIGGQGGRKAPELTKVGAEATHTADWLIAHVKDPKTHNPGSRMPAYQGKINDTDLKALGAYLASLK